jgi:hypothetical protein
MPEMPESNMSCHDVKNNTIHIKFYIKPLHKTFLFPSVVQHFINLISPYITDVTAAPGTGIKEPTTAAKTGVTRCEKIMTKNF